MQITFWITLHSAVPSLMKVTLFLVLMFCTTQRRQMVGGDLGVVDFHRDISLLTVLKSHLQTALESYRKCLSIQQLIIPHL